MDSITSFSGSINTKRAFKRFCLNLYQIGVRAEIIKEKEAEILNIFEPRNTATSDQTDHRNTMDESRPHNATTSDQIDDSSIADQSKPQTTAIPDSMDDSNILNQNQLVEVSDYSCMGICLKYTNRK